MDCGIKRDTGQKELTSEIRTNGEKKMVKNDMSWHSSTRHERL
jgi:hypothetical protein